MGENDFLGLFQRYTPSKPMCNDVGCTTNVPTIEYVGIDTSGNPIYKPNTPCGTILKLSPTDSQRIASAKAELDAMAYKLKPIADELVEEIYKSSQKPIKLLSEVTAQQTNEAFENIRKTMEKDFPIALKTTKRKHYKPKFTL